MSENEQTVTVASKKSKKKKVAIIIGIVAASLLVVSAGVVGAGALVFKEELSIISTIRKGESKYPYYTMEFKDGYHLNELLQNDIRTDKELSKILSTRISHGFYTPSEFAVHHLGCSVLSATTNEGNLVWGRNYDWYRAMPIIVKATPQGSYASISTCDFGNVISQVDATPEGFANSLMAIASYYVPLDGINEKGLCVADLEINEGGQHAMETGKTHITMTMAIRLLLDRAATVDEAVALLNQYDVCPSGNISAHLAISDRSGKAVVVEFMNNKVEVTESPYVTNFNIKNGNLKAGGDRAKNRYESLKRLYDGANGHLSKEQMKTCMYNVLQTDGQWKTKWTIVYEDNQKDGNISASYYWYGELDNPLEVTLR